MIGFSLIELVTLIVLGGSPLGVPLSLPPLPEDPVMAQVAPEECLWYLTWSGCAKADPASKNHTEQLLAEQEVQRFTRELEMRLREAIKRGAPQGEQASQAATLAEEGPNLIKFVFTRPAALFIERVAITPAGANVKGGAVISAGEQAGAIKQSIDRIAAVLLPGRAAANGSSGELKIPTPQGAPPVELRWHKDYLVIGIGDEAADRIIQRFGGEAPEWFTKIRKELPVERTATVHYLNIKSAMTTALPLTGLEGFRVANVLGFDRLSHYASVTGLEGNGAVTRGQLAMDGKPRGVFALFDNEPLKASDLAQVPKDASFAAIGKFNADKAFKGLVDFVGQFDPASEQQFKAGWAQAEKQLGFKLSEDVFQSLGDTWSVYNSPGEGGLLITGLTAVVEVKNRERLVAAHDKLLASIRAMNAEMERLNADPNNRGRRPSGMVVSDFKFAGQTIYFLNFIGDEVPIAPAWCITDDQLVISLFPQMIKARLSRGEKIGSLGDLPEVARLFTGDQKPLAVFYQDTRSVFRLAYPVLHIFAAFICNQLQQERVDIDMSLLPSMAAIEPHLQPGVSGLYFGSDGVRWESRQTLPGAGAAPLLVASAGFLSFRAVEVQRFEQAAATRSAVIDLEALTPEGAQRTVSTNNLKQIGIAMHNFHDTFNHFPVADGARRDGKPKLSWRVHILPFIEQDALFKQFKLDEPWDSPNNKKLIEKMPKIYAAPGSKVAQKHMTNYLTVRGKDTMFPAGKETSLARVTDGTSNTVMVLEVDDEHAVVWTKPDDFEPNKDDPLKGVVGLRNGKFLTLFGDASVRLLPGTLSKETVRAIYTQAGGEVVNLPN